MGEGEGRRGTVHGRAKRRWEETSEQGFDSRQAATNDGKIGFQGVENHDYGTCPVDVIVVKVFVEVVYAEYANDADSRYVNDAQKFDEGETHNEPTEKTEMRMRRCFMGTRTVQRVRMGQRKMRKSEAELRAWAA